MPFIPDFDFTFRNSCLGYAFSIIFSTYTNVRRYTCIFVLSILRGIDIDTNTSSFIFGFVFNIFIGQCTCGDFIFVFFSFTGDNTAFEVSISFYTDIKAFFACVNTALVSNTFVVAVNITLCSTTKDTCLIGIASLVFFIGSCYAIIFIFTTKINTNTKTSRRVLLFIRIFVLLAFDVKVSAYVTGNLFTAQIATFNVGVLGTGKVKFLIRLDSAFIVGGAVGIYFAFALAPAYSDTAYLTCCYIKAYANACTAGFTALLRFIRIFRRSYIKVFFSV